MATKHQVISCHKKHPTWPAGRIALELGCGDAYVRKTADRNGLVLPSCRDIGKTPDDLRRKAREMELAARRLRQRADKLEQTI